MMKLRKIILVLAIPCLALIGCKAQKAAIVQEVLPVVTYEKGKARCHKCEQYVITINNDGSVNYDGQANMDLMGVSSFKIADSDMADIERQLSQIDVNTLEELYRSNIRDLPIMGLTIGGKRVRFQKKVCPSELVDLVAKIESLVPGAER